MSKYSISTECRIVLIDGTEATSRRIVAILLVLFALLIRNSPGADPTWERVYEGRINGRLCQAFNGGMTTTKPTLADIDGDGDLDFFVGRADGKIRYYRNDGMASFPSFTLADDRFLGITGSFSGNQEGTHCRPAVADMDGDGDQDLVYGEYTGTLTYYRNNGSATAPAFGLSTQYFGSITVGGFAQPSFCDIDADGDPDLFLGYGSRPGGSTGGVQFYRNTGDAATPSFVLDASLLIPLPGGADLSPALADIDADGDYDLFVGTYSGEMQFYRNIGTSYSPTFLLQTNPFPSLPPDRWMTPAFADLDGDYDMDCFTGGQCGLLLFYRNAGTSTSPAFEPPITHLPGISFDLEVGGWGTNRGQHSTPALADVDDDGDLDLFMGQYNPGQINFYQNNGSPRCPGLSSATGAFAGITFSSSHDPNAVLGHPCFGDTDGDGDPDLYIGKEDGFIALYRNDGPPSSPNFALMSSTYLSAGSGSVWAAPTLADIDGDGDLDLIAGERGGSLLLFRNNGTPTSPSFSAGTSLGINPGQFPKPALCDIDRDGDLDLFVGVEQTAGRSIVFYRNTGTTATPVFTLVTNNYASIPPGYYYPAPTFGDIDGDGDDDLIAGSSEGGVIMLLNETPHLTIQPSSQTAIPGQSVDFTVPGSIPGTPTWQLLRNRSGGTVDPASGHYVAGSNASVLDAIEVRDGTGTTGRAYINVISPSQLSASGKAVIMAGRKSNDPLWATTNNLAHFVYRSLLYRGFSRDNIYYLNPDTNQNVDRDATTVDIDAASSRANIHYALSTWAAGSPNLFVYLIDHGQEQSNNVFVRCNESDVLYASELNQWLDTLQASGTTMLTLVVDCCQSGGFINKCHATGGQQRIVIGSADKHEPAFFTAGGLISFTQTFVGGLYTGLTVGHAFDLAAGAMDRYQHPQLDDDGNGVYHRDVDGALARTVTIGASFIAGADRPQIGKIVANQSLSGGSTTATVWAAEVSSVYPIDRVWATLAPPNFIPQAQIDPGQPALGLPELEMTWNIVNSRYEATTNTFTQLGAYAVNLYARDIWGGVAYPKQTYVNQAESDERMIVLCGDGAYDGNSPWSFSDTLAERAYSTASARWLTDAKITYLTSGTHPGRRDGAPTRANFQNAIANATGVTKLTLYLVGRGSASAFDIDGDSAASDPDDVTSFDLDGWLDSLQSAGSTQITVILDFSRSGAWMSPLAPSAGKKRIVLTSCSGLEDSWCEEGGIFSFSQWFLAEVFNGVNLRDAFNWTRLALRAITGETQNAQLDDDGSGIGDWRDGALSSTTYIGAAFVTGDDEPTLGDYAQDVPLPTNTATLWASGVWAPKGIAEVFAYVVRPGATSTHDATDKVQLAYNSANGRWESTYSSFTPNGYHPVIYFVKDQRGQLSSPYRATFGITHADAYDRLYADDSADTLNFLSNDTVTSQVHNLWTPGDEDWSLFNADPARWYSVQATDQATSCNARIVLYSTDDLTSPLITRDDWGPGGPDELISWWSGSHSGTMAVKIIQSPTFINSSSESTTYTLRVTGDWGPNAGLGTISGTRTVIGPQGGLCQAGLNGIYTKHALEIPPGALSGPTEIILDDPGDVGNYPWFAETRAWLAAHPANASLVRILADPPTAFAIPATLTVQFVDDGPGYEGFVIDDLPPDATVGQMQIHEWTGTGWQPVPLSQTVVGDTVLMPISSVAAVSYYGAAPVPLPGVVDWMWF